MSEGFGPAWDRLIQQEEWYDKKSRRNQRYYKWLKGIEISAAAVVPVLAFADVSRWLVAGVGSAVVVLEGIQQLNQYQRNWLLYRSTCEALRHEKHLSLSGAGPYKESSEPRKLLAERIEALISTENAKWVESHHEEVKARTKAET